MSTFDVLGEQFIQYALAASVLVGCLCSILGVYVILKRIVFLGITISEVSALGVALGLFLGLNPSLSSIVITTVAVLIFWIPMNGGSVSKESIIGFAYVIAAALSVILVAKNPMAESRGLDLISGNLLYVQRGDILVLAATVLVVVALQLLFYNKFIFVSFDPETASTMGIRASFYDLLIYLSLGLGVAISMKVAGVLFVFGFLVIPALAGFLLSNRIIRVFLIGALFSVVSSFTGVLVSVRFDWPTSPTILVTAGTVFILLLLVKAAVSMSGGLSRGRR